MTKNGDRQPKAATFGQNMHKSEMGNKHKKGQKQPRKVQQTTKNVQKRQNE